MLKVVSATLVLLALTLGGCQRELNPDLNESVPLPPAQNADTARIKSINIVEEDPTNPINYTTGIEYDSMNHRINFYKDDPATPATLFDQLLFTYQFNPQGYMTKVSALNYNDVFVTQFDIARDASNNIISIKEENIEMPAHGITTYVKYAQSGNQTVITDSVKPPSPQAGAVDRYITFDAQKRVVKMQRFHFLFPNHSLTYSYNSLGYPNRLVGPYDTVDVVYGSNPLPPGWKANRERFLGKDAWLLAELAPIYQENVQHLSAILPSYIEWPRNILFDPIGNSYAMKGQFMIGMSLAPTVDQVNQVNTFLPDGRLLSTRLTGPQNEPMTYTFTYY